MCRTPVPRSNPYRRCGNGGATPGGCDGAERLPPSPSDPQLSIDLRKTALLRSMLLRTEVHVQPLSTVCSYAQKLSYILRSQGSETLLILLKRMRQSSFWDSNIITCGVRCPCACWVCFVFCPPTDTSAKGRLPLAFGNLDHSRFSSRRRASPHPARASGGAAGCQQPRPGACPPWPRSPPPARSTPSCAALTALRTWRQAGHTAQMRSAAR